MLSKFQLKMSRLKWNRKIRWLISFISILYAEHYANRDLLDSKCLVLGLGPWPKVKKLNQNTHQNSKSEDFQAGRSGQDYSIFLKQVKKGSQIHHCLDQISFFKKTFISFHAASHFEMLVENILSIPPQKNKTLRKLLKIKTKHLKYL